MFLRPIEGRRGRTGGCWIDEADAWHRRKLWILAVRVRTCVPHDDIGISQ
jgi:hypothetical protein